MRAISTLWGILLLLSVVSFTILSLRISVKGFDELKDILQALKRPGGNGPGPDQKTE
ncbi:MAG TPA: hypothetical protein PLX50_00310 [Candidatus Aminicenantes bacterium]|nr:hypothetical protein [Acidobacteriota bacterium]HOI44031.1 hypothetical protein [Candidatus Aminicenantes bacterium]